MKHIELSRQERWNYCLCSTLQAIFRDRNIKMSQDDIAGNLTYSKEGRFIADDMRAKAFMAKMGFGYHVIFSKDIPVNVTPYLLSEMCDNYGIVGINGHAHLLEDFAILRLRLVDPKDGKEIEKKYPEVLKEMNPDGVFLLIKPLQ